MQVGHCWDCLAPSAPQTTSAAGLRRAMRRMPVHSRPAVLCDVSNTCWPAEAGMPHACDDDDSSGSKLQRRRVVVVTPSGFRGAAAKQELQQLAASIGASCCGDLVQGHTTHLVRACVRACNGRHVAWCAAAGAERKLLLVPMVCPAGVQAPDRLLRHAQVSVRACGCCLRRAQPHSAPTQRTAWHSTAWRAGAQLVLHAMQHHHRRRHTTTQVPPGTRVGHPHRQLCLAAGQRCCRTAPA